MDLMNFLAGATSALVSRYRSLANGYGLGKSTEGTSRQTDATGTDRYRPRDTYVPGSRVNRQSSRSTRDCATCDKTTDTKADTDTVDLSGQPAATTPSETNPNQNPDGTLP